VPLFGVSTGSTAIMYYKTADLDDQESHGGWGSPPHWPARRRKVRAREFVFEKQHAPGTLKIWGEPFTTLRSAWRLASRRTW